MSAWNQKTRRNVQVAAARLSGTEGPLRTALSELAKFGIGERIVKSALAATLAWMVAAQIPRESAPFVAALTAVYTIDLTILKSVRSAGQRLAGIVLGVGVAFLAAETVGVHSWSAGIVILISLVIGLRLNLKPDGMTQVAGTAIVVLVVRSTTEERSIYALTFLADTALGTGIGLAVNMLFAPPNLAPSSRRALEALTKRLTTLLDQLAEMVSDGISADEADLLSGAITQMGKDLLAVDESLQQAEESLKYSPLAGVQRGRIAAYHAADRHLEATVTGLQVLVTGLRAAQAEVWMSDRRLTEAISSLISAIGAAIQESSLDGFGSTEIDLSASLTTVLIEAERIHASLRDDSWMTLGQVVESTRMLAESLHVGEENMQQAG